MRDNRAPIHARVTAGAGGCRIVRGVQRRAARHSNTRIDDGDAYGAEGRSAPVGVKRLDVEAAYGVEGRRAPAGVGRLDADRAVATLAARQAGVVSRHQVLAIGLSARAIGRRIQAGRWHVLHRGVYAVGHTAITWEGHTFPSMPLPEPSPRPRSSGS